MQENPPRATGRPENLILGAQLTANYSILACQHEEEHLRLAQLQEQRMTVSRDEDDIEVSEKEDGKEEVEVGARDYARFGEEASYVRPSAYKKDLIEGLPASERLTRD